MSIAMKKLFALLLLCVSAAVQAGPQIQHWTALSGARVYFIESHALPILDVQVDFLAGSVYDPPGKSGLAGLTNGLLDSGLKDMDEEKIAGRLVDLGAQLAGSLDSDRAGLRLRTLSSATERNGALDLMAAVLAGPTYPAAVLEREKARHIAAIQEADTRPDSIAAKRFAAEIYPGHGYGLRSTVDSISAIGRDDLVVFHARHYSAANAVVSLIGDISRTEAEAIAQRLTAALPAGEKLAPPPAVSLPEAKLVRVAHPASQSHIHVGMPALRRDDPDYYALLVGNYTLGGGGFVSRLMQEVREKRGYAYSVYSYLAPRRLEGPFEIGLQTKRAQAGEALKVVNEVLAKFLAEGPTAQELKAAKQNLVDGLALRLDSNAKLLSNLAAIAFYQLPLSYLDDYPAKVNAVTREQVTAAFARHVKPEHLVTVVVAAD
ncbi:peptidase M16 [Denitratisoma oestradiolicum]|nr:peptidase M16 [Denitratisoma oestradiolicum]